MEKTMEKVSIVMPTYNCGKYIKASIESVQSQNYTNWELLIVDDCSTDDTEKIVNKLKETDKRIHYYRFNKNQGPAAARNYAIKKAKGEYIAFLDSDDLWKPDKLKIQLRFMSENNASLCCTSYGLIDETGKVTKGVVIPFKKADYWLCLFYGNCIGNSTAMYHVKNGKKYYTPDIRKRNDFALWLKILKTEKYVYGLREPLVLYRVRNNSISANKRNLIKYQWELYRKIEKLNLLQCVCAFATLAIRKCWTGFVHRR